MDDNTLDASATQTGLSPTVEPASSLAGSAASIPSVEDAKSIEQQARSIVAAIEAEASRIGHEAARDARKRLGIDAAHEAVAAAVRVRVAAEDALPLHKWDGRQVQLVEQTGPRWNSKTTHIVGVVETRRHATSFPANQTWLPEIGDAFVRLLKKDGTPGSKFVRMRPYQKWQLVPAKGIEAAKADETGTGSAEGESPVRDSAFAQTSGESH